MIAKIITKDEKEIIVNPDSIFDEYERDDIAAITLIYEEGDNCNSSYFALFAMIKDMID